MVGEPAPRARIYPSYICVGAFVEARLAAEPREGQYATIDR
jgi:hypothetical protein